MALRIVEKLGVFHVSGELNNWNTPILSNRLILFFKQKHHVKVNLEKVTSFDNKAAYALLKLFVSAQHQNCRMSIIGKKNKNLLLVLNDTNTLHIWNQTNYLK